MKHAHTHTHIRNHPYAYGHFVHIEHSHEHVHENPSLRHEGTAPPHRHTGHTKDQEQELSRMLIKATTRP